MYTFCEINFTKIFIVNKSFPSKCSVVKKKYSIDKILDIVLNECCVQFCPFILKIKTLKIHVYRKYNASCVFFSWITP